MKPLSVEMAYVLGIQKEIKAVFLLYFIFIYLCLSFCIYKNRLLICNIETSICDEVTEVAYRITSFSIETYSKYDIFF